MKLLCKLKGIAQRLAASEPFLGEGISRINPVENSLMPMIYYYIILQMTLIKSQS